MREISFWDIGGIAFSWHALMFHAMHGERKRFRLLFFRFQDPAAGQMDKSESILLLFFIIKKPSC